ncbi:non-ribosomal peptide synthetase [Luteibacter sp. 9135]|uniref:non-ribosomal peptide synthetase n=1 Tax=Luteibacter sp. 9135 TaxID=1500893 RepID=UPI0009DE8737|nr:non-ribosomal peptide synthetase [Luteibacter sp. 9135]
MPIDVLEKARAKNIDLSVVDGRLKVRAKAGALDDELRQEITLNKDLLIELLSDIQASKTDPDGNVIKPVARAAAGSPLSFAQQRLWFIDQHEAGSSQYNIPTALSLRGDLNKGALQKAIDALMERHQVLRTTYTEVDGRAVQIVHPSMSVRMTEIDLTHIDETAAAAEVERLVRVEANVAFNLRQDPILRVSLLKLAATNHVLLFTMHHIASDGWSVGVLTREFVALYEAFHQGRDNPLAPLGIQYADFAHWQRETLRDEVVAGQLGYWERELAAAPTVHRLPLDRPRPAEQNFEGRIVRQHLEPELRTRLNELARENGATLFMLLECAFALLLARWSHEDDIVIGTPIAGRTHSQLEPLIGFFVNTLVFRHQFDGEQSFTRLLAEAKQKALDAYANQDVPFDMVVERVQPKRSLAHSPLFQVLFALQNNEQATLDLPELSIDTLTGGQQTIKFDLELAISESEAGLWLSWTYACSLFDRATIERISASFGALLRHIVAAPQTPVYRLALGSASDLAPQRATVRPVGNLGPEDPCLHREFEKHVEAQPHATALVFEETSLTYRQLNERANKIAHWLIQQGVRPDSIVVLCIDRSLDMVVAILATWKAGGAYLPIDPAYPSSRIDYILQDSKMSALLTNSRMAASHAFNVGAQLSLDDDRAVLDFPNGNPDIDGLTAESLAYVIYTSGSTGTPKGVCIAHRSLSHLSRHLDDITGRPAVWGWMTSYVFDASLQGLTRLGHGGCLVVMDDSHKLDVARLASVLDRHPVDIVDCTPSIVESWLDQDCGHMLPDLLIGGEAISTALWKRLDEWQGRHGRKAINVYGPTECCVDSTWATITGDMPHIGEVLGDTVLHVLSEDGQSLPLGVPGELYIGGPGLARGYLNRPELTTSRFVEIGEAGARFYRTGDIVRWRADGNLEFLGRADGQVKIRGFRIETGEIEYQLNSLPAVRTSAVLAVEGDAKQKRLVAYVVPRQAMGAGFSESDFADGLRAALEASLAAHMVPSAFKILPRLPLNASGKLDKKALALLETTAPADDRYAGPRNAAEALLCEIWQTLLRVEKVGIHDNFFQLGGDSILSIQVVARANKAGIPLTTRQLFASQTVAELALGGQEGTQATDAPQQAVLGALELLPIQKAFLSTDREHVQHFNQTVLLATPASFDFAALKSAVGYILRRHDALRLRFEARGDDWAATHQPLTDTMVDDSCLHEVLPAGIDGEAITQRCEHHQRALEIGKPPLLRAVYFEGAGSGRLLLVAHHLVVDGVSWRILLSDLEQAYRTLQGGQAPSLAPKTSSFQQWGAALAAHAASDALQGERAFWHAQFADPVPPFPVDFEARQAPRRGTTRIVRLGLSEGEAAKLLRECGAAYRTDINELLLSAVYLGMRRWTRAPGLRVILEGHGREDLFEALDTTQTVGWFTTTYPLALRCDDVQIPTVIRSVKEHYRSVPNKGIGYGVLRYLAGDAVLAQAEKGSRAQVVFNYLGQFDQTFDDASLFQFAPESTGTDVDPERRRDQILELNGMVALGKLQFELSYSDEEFTSANMERLAGYIEGALKSVIEHCAPSEGTAPIAERPRAGLLPSDFPMARVTPAELDTWQARYDIENLYPATSMQQGMLYHSMLDASAYVSQIYPTFTGTLDAALFRQAWQAVVDRYDILRTVFVGEGEQLHQLVVPTVDIPWVEVDLRSLTEEQQAERFEDARRRDKALGFDASCAPMLRITLFWLSERRFKVLWSSHHMLLDGWSTPLVYRDVMTAYQALLRGEAAPLPPVAPFSHYISWLQAQDGSAAASYWKAHLADVRRPTPLVIDRMPGERGRGHRARSVQLSREVSDRLQAFAKRSHTTVNTLMQLAWGLLLHRYSGEQTVTFGATISGRPAAVAGIESMVGLFINTIPVKVSFQQTDVASLIATLHASFQDSNDYGYLPLSEVQSYSPVASHTPLFDSLIAFENFPIDAATGTTADASSHGLAMDGLGSDEQTNYKLTLVATMQEVLTISCRYRGDDVAEEAVEALLQGLVALLEQLPVSDSVSSIELPDDAFHTRLRRVALQSDDAAPAAGAVGDVHAAVAPRTETEADMLAIWQDVLAVEITSIRDGFFDLGGNSLKAMRVAGHVAAHFGIERSLKALFIHNTIESLSNYVDGQKQVARVHIPVADKDEAIPLSFSQQQLWIVDQVSGGSPHYNMPFALRLRGDLDRSAMQRGLEAIIARHAVLRTVFARTEAGPVQVIQPAGSIDFPVFDLTGLDESAKAAAVTRHMSDEASTAFHLERDRPLRVRLLALGEQDHVLLLTMHHIASDGWSIGVLSSEFVALYTALRDGREAVLPELDIQYADFAQWQRTAFAEEMERQWKHWEHVLKGAPPLHALPLDKPRPAQQTFTGAVHTHVVDRDLWAALHALGKQYDATPFMVLQSAYATLLSRWSRETDIVVGSPVAGRTHKQLGGLIGFFVNTLVFRHQLGPEKRFSDVLVESRKQAIDAFANQDIPLEMLVDRLQPERSLSHSPVVQVMFSLQNQNMGELRLPGLEIEGVGESVPVAKFDLELDAVEHNGELHLGWRYATSLFEAATIERMAASFLVLLRSIVEAPERSLRELPLMATEFVARKDSQVRIRGYHIDPGRVEAALSACHAVQEAAVVARKDAAGADMLVAYVVPAQGQPLLPVDLRAQLAADIPEYMVPAAFVALDAFPTTPDGKRDIDALPAPAPSRADDQAYEAPVGVREETLAGIWQELFGLERIGRQDNFFDIGGNSIRAIQTVMQAGKIGLDIKIGSIFKHQTIQGICAAHDANVEMAPVAGEAFAPLSPYQHAVLESGAAAAGCWHVQVEVGPDITETHFRQWVKDTLASQGALRSVIQEKDGSHSVIRVEANRERLRSVVNVHDVTGMRAEAVASTLEAARADVEHTLATLQGLLLRAALFVGDASSMGTLSVHRALLDKAQWDTLSEQFRCAFLSTAR